MELEMRMRNPRSLVEKRRARVLGNKTTIRATDMFLNAATLGRGSVPYIPLELRRLICLICWRESNVISHYEFRSFQHRLVYPLSSVRFRTRKELYEFGLTVLDSSRWGFDKIRSIWYVPYSNPRVPCAMILNEMCHHIGQYVLFPETSGLHHSATLPCFLRTMDGIRYSGTWSFAHDGTVVVPQHRPLQRLRMTLVTYDIQWGARR